MELIWIIFIIIAIEEMVCNGILKNKKQAIVYSSIVFISIALCIIYYSDEYNSSILGMVNKMINLERFIWIK